MYKLRLGRSVSIANEEYSETLAEMKDLAFDSADVDICGCWQYGERPTEWVDKIEWSMEKFVNTGMYFNGCHMPFGLMWDWATCDEQKREGCVKGAGELFRRIDPFHPFCYVFHGSLPLTWYDDPDNREPHIEALKKSVREMQNLTDTLICIETLPRTCLLNTVKETLDVIDDLKGVKICHDVNHLLFDSTEDAIIAFGDRISTTHISDYDKTDERHWMPGKGIIDWNKLIGNFEKIGYKGVFNYELGYPSKEIRENYDTLFENYNRSKKK